MIVLSILGSLAAVSMLCSLLFTLAVFALPAFAGVVAGLWAHQTGAGIPGSLFVGIVAAGATFSLGHLLLAFARPLWLRIAVVFVFVVPAGIAGFHATHGIVKYLMLSETWQLAFSLAGAVAVGITTFIRVSVIAAPGTAASASHRFERT